MPEFIADTDGVVNGASWDDLSDFQKGYVEAMLFTETNERYYMTEWLVPEVQHEVSEGYVSGNIPYDSGWGDIHPDSAIKLHNDCRAFQSEAAAALSQAYARDYDETQAGRDFWFTRCGHGVGYWDRKELAADGLGNTLSAIAKRFGEVDVYFSDPDPESPTGYGYVCF